MLRYVKTIKYLLRCHGNQRQRSTALVNKFEISPNYQLLVNFIYKMAAKELKALVDIGTSLGYTGEDLKQWLNDERMKIDREKERRNGIRTFED